MGAVGVLLYYKPDTRYVREFLLVNFDEIDTDMQ